MATNETTDGDDSLSTEEAADIAEDIMFAAGEVEDGLNRGPDQHNVLGAMDRMEESIRETKRQMEDFEDALQVFFGGGYSDGISEAMEGMEAAWDANATVRERAALLHEFLHGLKDDAEAATVTLGGETYRVSVEAIGSEADTDDE